MMKSSLKIFENFFVVLPESLNFILVLPERMQQMVGLSLLGAFIYLVQLVGFDGGFFGAQDQHGSTRLHEAALRGLYPMVIKTVLNI